MISSQHIQLIEAELSKFAEYFNSQDEELLALSVGPRAFRRFVDRVGEDVGRGFVLGLMASGLEDNVQSMNQQEFETIIAEVLGHDSYQAPYPEAMMDDGKDVLQAAGVNFDEDISEEQVIEKLTEVQEHAVKDLELAFEDIVASLGIDMDELLQDEQSTVVDPE